MASLFEELGLANETESQRLARELADDHLELIAALRAVREHLELSQAELGARMGVSQATVSAFESGESEPRLSTVRRYAHALGANVRTSVTHQGTEFTSAPTWAVRWDGRVNAATSLTSSQVPLQMGAARAKKTDFAVAA